MRFRYSRMDGLRSNQAVARMGRSHGRSTGASGFRGGRMLR